MQPQGGSSGTPPQSGRGVPPRGSNLHANAPPYFPIPKQVQEVPLEQLLQDVLDQAKRGLAQSGRGSPPRDSSLPVATVLPHSLIPGQVQEVPLEQLFNDVRDEGKRRRGLSQLVKRMRSVPDISIKIRNRPWMRDLIISEIQRIHPYIDRQEEIPDDYFYRAFFAIALLDPLAKDESSRDYFLQAMVLEDLCPFLKNPMESKNFNNLRLTSLGVIKFLVKKSDIQTVKHLLQLNIVTLCIRCMKVHSCESTIASAVTILEKILRTKIGLASICDNQERYLKIIHLLASMFKHPHITPSLKLLKKVVSCFCLFSYNPSVSKSLHKYLPDTFKDGSFRELFEGEDETLERVYQAIFNAYKS